MVQQPQVLYNIVFVHCKPGQVSQRNIIKLTPLGC